MLRSGAQFKPRKGRPRLGRESNCSMHWTESARASRKALDFLKRRSQIHAVEPPDLQQAKMKMMKIRGVNRSELLL